MNRAMYREQLWRASENRGRMSEETFCKMKAGDIHLDGARRTSLKIWYEGKV